MGDAIRPMKRSDIPAMVAIAVEAEMFPQDGIDFLIAHGNAWFDGDRQGGAWVVDEADDELAAVAYYEPRDAADRVWFLKMIAVSPKVQGRGRGAALLQWIEDELRRKDQRLLIVETSSTHQYTRARAFYGKLGFAEVGRVPDYFADGDDMVMFRKDLRTPDNAPTP